MPEKTLKSTPAQRKANKTYFDKNKQKIHEIHKQYYQKNAEKIKKNRMNRYYQAKALTQNSTFSPAESGDLPH
jgi:hypothetical protein